MTISYYKNKAELQLLKEEALSKGKSTLHIDFVDIDGTPTDGNSGRYESIIRVNPIPTADEIKVKELKETNR